MRTRYLEACRWRLARTAAVSVCCEIANHLRPPWNQTSTGFLAEVFGVLVQIFKLRQSSLEGLPVCAANMFHTRKPEGSAKFGNGLTGGLFDRQSAAQSEAL